METATRGQERSTGIFRVLRFFEVIGVCLWSGRLMRWWPTCARESRAVAGRPGAVVGRLAGARHPLAKTRPTLRGIEKCVAAQLVDPLFGHEGRGSLLRAALGAAVVERLFAGHSGRPMRDVDDLPGDFPDRDHAGLIPPTPELAGDR